MSKPLAVCLDVDGTLCDVTSIRHHVLNPKKKNYDAFHYLSVYCPPIEWVVEAARKLDAAGFKIIVMTARMEKWRLLTENWLDHNDIPFDEVWMRPNSDLRPDRAVKEEILAELEYRFRIVHAVDDNPQIVQMWRDHNIPVTEVPGWEEEWKEEVESLTR